MGRETRSGCDSKDSSTSSFSEKARGSKSVSGAEAGIPPQLQGSAKLPGPEILRHMVAHRHWFWICSFLLAPQHVAGEIKTPSLHREGTDPPKKEKGLQRSAHHFFTRRSRTPARRLDGDPKARVVQQSARDIHPYDRLSLRIDGEHGPAIPLPILNQP